MHAQVSVNDMLTHVDNTDVTPMSLDKINSQIKGPVGTNGTSPQSTPEHTPKR